MKQFHTKFPTQVGPLKIVHVIECNQEDTEDDDAFRYQVSLITPEGCGAAIGYRSAKIVMFHDPSGVELETSNRESRKSASAPKWESDQEERVATKGKRR